MHLSHKSTRAALQFVALQLFAALACAASAPSNAPRTHAPAAYGPAATYLRTSDPSSAQRRRRRRGRLLRLDSLTPGVWGGEHARFEVTDAGATIDLDCAHVKVEGKIQVDGAGRFSAEGTYYQEHGGPVREEEEARPEQVRLTGRVGGSLLTLTVTRGKTQVGTYTLARDRQAHVVKCR